MSRRFLRVGKVGGSLLDFADLPSALRGWLDLQPGVNVLVAGGGAYADSIRQADDTFQLGHETAHRLALEAMRLSGRLLEALLPECLFCESIDHAQQELAAGNRKLIVLDSYDAVMHPNCPLSRTWDVTSDSIAAEIARQLDANELVLFKSTQLPANTNREQATEAGLVDSHFAETTIGFPAIRWVNLRETPVTERPF